MPVHWSTAGAAAQCISLRLAPAAGNAGEDGQWSAPLDAALQGGAVCHLALPCGRDGSGDAGVSDLDVHGPRVARGLQLPGRCVHAMCTSAKAHEG